MQAKEADREVSKILSLYHAKTELLLPTNTLKYILKMRVYLM